MPVHARPPSAVDTARTVVRRPAPFRRLLLCVGAGAFVASCASAPSRALPAIPALGHGSTGASALAPAIAVPSLGAVSYEVEGVLPALEDHAAVYRAGTTVDGAELSRLAKAFGLSGSVQVEGSGWTVADGDKRLRVERVGGLPWTVSSSESGGSVSSGCAVAVPGNAGGGAPVPSTPESTCPPPTTVAGLPDEQGAEATARAVLAEAGIDLSGAAVRTSQGSSAWTVNFDTTLGGRAVLGGTTSVVVGPHGAIASASGHLARLSPVGTYPLVGVTAALDRLRQGWDWIVYSGPMPMMAQGAPAEGSSPAGGAPGSTAAEPVGPATSEAQPTAPTTTGPPRVVKITGIRLALAWAWPMAQPAADAWLVPVYVFDLGAGSPYPFLGGGVPVLAVADRYVATPTTTTTTGGAAVPGGRPSSP